MMDGVVFSIEENMNTKLPKEVIIAAVKACCDVYPQQNDFIVNKSIDGYCILAVEGTNEMNDWATNLKFLFRSEDTHRGFKDNANRTLTELVLNYESLDKSRKLVLAGHSLGGATATILADIMLSKTPDLSLVTIGSPRPGGRKLRERIKGIDHLRFVHGNDVVPTTPPWINGYVHTHPEIHLEDVNDKKFDGVEDHNAHYYFNAIVKLLNE
jgi:predicted lipase